MTRATAEEVYPLFHACFPEVTRGSFDVVAEITEMWHIEGKAFCMCFRVGGGLFIQYIGVVEEERGHGLCRDIMLGLKQEYSGLRMYGEVDPTSRMYKILSSNGWVDVPISYVCPAWGEEPEDTSRNLLTAPILGYNKQEVFDWIGAVYRDCYEAKADHLLERYRKELQLC